MSRLPSLLALAFASAGFALAQTLPPEESKLRFIEALNEDFLNNQRAWALLSAGEAGRSEITNGVFRWDHRGTGFRGSALTLRIAGSRPLEFSVDVRFGPEAGTGSAGLQWGGTTGLTSWNHFLLTRDGRFVIGRVEDGAQGVETKLATGSVAMPADRASRLMVRVLGNKTAAFVNGRVVWVGDSLPFGQHLSGVIVTPPVQAEFDTFVVRHVRADESVLAERLAAYTAAIGRDELVFSELPTPSVAVVHAATAVAPETVLKWEQEGFDLHQAGKYREAEALFRRVLQQQPENTGAYVNLSWCLLNLGDVPGARAAAETAQALDQVSVLPVVMLAYTSGAAGDAAAARTWYQRLAAFDGDGANLEGLRKDLNDLAKSGQTRAVEVLRPALEAAYQTHRGRLAALNAALVAMGRSLQTRDLNALRAAAQDAEAQAGALPAEFRDLAPWVLHQIGTNLGVAGDRVRALAAQEKAYSALRPLTAPSAAFGRSNSAVQLALSYYEASNFERVVELLSGERSAALALPAYANRLKGDLLQTLAGAANALARPDVVRQAATDLLAVSGTGRDDWYRAWGFFYRAAAATDSNVPAEVAAMKASFQQALELAEAKRFDAIADAARSGLAFVFWKEGNNAAAEQLYLAAAAQAESRSDFVRAEALFNNLGAVQYAQKNYPAAVRALRQAVAMTERAREKATPEERIGLLGTRLSAYQFLVLALHHTGDQGALFEAMASARARVLAETLGTELGARPTTLAEFQATLRSDEAAVVYTLIGGGEYVAQVVTRTGAQSLYHDGRPQMVPLKQQYLDRLNAARPGYKPAPEIREVGGNRYRVANLASTIARSDLEGIIELYREAITAKPEDLPRDFRRELLDQMEGGLGDAFLRPVGAAIAGKARLILMPDGIQYFLPFEALRLGGQPLLATHDVRYVQSAEVWLRLRQRDYSQAPRSSFLGMGGALYSAMEEVAPPLTDATRQVQLQIEAQRNGREGRSQREIYSALFGNKPMNFLAGSLYEVQALGRIFPDSQIFTGRDMSEPRLKAMARDGSLAKFRIVHLATHGFAVPEVPELSGIAMTLTPRAEGGEDGYLTAPEIARLGMKADLVVLSACETGLGRIYNGEGVAGLTGALLAGGANRALVSLWPVSDAGTMQFMHDVYQLVTTEGLDYDTAVNRVKRKFLAGAYGPEFQDLEIWAPFIHYGL